MAIETFRRIEYSDETKFTKADDRIELKKYTDDLLFYVSFDSNPNANFSSGDSVASVTGTYSSENGGVFGQFGFLQNCSLEYNANNFTGLTEEGCCKFRVKTGFNNAPGRQDFIATTNPIITAVPVIDTTTNRFGGASLNLTGNEEKRVEYNIDNIVAMIQTGAINFNLKFNYTGAPTTNVGIIDIKNAADNLNRITIAHETDGKMYFRIYDQVGVEQVNINFVWSADMNWHEVELNFDLNAGASRVFIDGTQYGATNSSTATRINVTGSISVGSIGPSISNHFVDDVAFFSSVQHTSDYSPRTIAFSGAESNLILYMKYDTTLNGTFGIGTINYSSATPANNDYEFKLTVNGTLFGGGDTIITLDSEDTMNDIRNKLVPAIAGSGSSATLLGTGNIRIFGSVDGTTILIEAPDTGRSLIELLGGVNDPELPNAPTVDVNIFELYNGSNNNDRVILTHDIESHLIIKMYDSSGTLKVDKDIGLWNNENITWYAFEFNWNKTMAQFYIDGLLKSVFITNFQRSGEIPLIISSGTVDFYKFDELIIYDEYQHNQDYTIETLALTPYAADDPYIDIFFGSGFKENEITDINLNCSSECNFVVKLANTWYYYLSGAWRTSDATFSQSVNPATMETKFPDLFFDENQELVIRAYFHSDGQVLVWLDEIDIVRITGEESPAIITGTIDLTNPVDLSVESHVIITTDQGSLEVDLSSVAADPANVTLDEIQQAIDDANVPGLAPTSNDGNGHLVLISENTGNDAYVSIAEGVTSFALPIVWGFESTDSGEEPTGVYYDYSTLFDWIRLKLGAPIAPVELTDEQLEACVGSAVYWYNYYRNAKENITFTYLNGSPHDGWDIPLEVGGESNIIEIILKPRFPYTYYLGRQDLIANLYVQYFFHKYKRGWQDIAGDYYITLSTEKDLENIMGTAVKWEFLNGKLFIHPEPVPGLYVGIKYRSAVTIEEINTNYFIKKYALGSAKEILGTIRGTFGGTMPGGTEMLTIRGTDLIAEGKEEKRNVIEQLMGLSEPMFLEWG